MFQMFLYVSVCKADCDPLGEPQNYMFADMRYNPTHRCAWRIDADARLSAALKIEKPIDILDHIYSLPPVEQEEAMEAIRQIERTAMGTQKPQPGLVKLMEYLTLQGIQKGICTRNFEWVSSCVC